MANSNIPEIVEFHKRISKTAEELISQVEYNAHLYD